MNMWIPVEERLPEANGRYLVTRGLNACGAMWNRVYLINYSDLMGLKSERIWWNGNVGKSDFERIGDVIAWMPLPKPYERSEEVEGLINSIPPAEPERKKGRWINDNGLYRCSSCNQHWAEWWAVSKPIERMKKEAPYCPMCGSYNGEGSEDDMG